MSNLHKACEQNNIISVTRILNTNPNLNLNEFSNNKLCELMYCINENKNIEIIKLLLKKGANVNLIYQEYTPLIVACYRNNEEIVKLLLDCGADVDLQNINTNTALMFYIEKKYKYKHKYY